MNVNIAFNWIVLFNCCILAPKDDLADYLANLSDDEGADAPDGVVGLDYGIVGDQHNAIYESAGPGAEHAGDDYEEDFS